MNSYMLFGIVWILIAMYNYYLLPEDMKKKTNFAAFTIFAILSPIVLVITLFQIHVLGKG